MGKNMKMTKNLKVKMRKGNLKFMMMMKRYRKWRDKKGKIEEKAEKEAKEVNKVTRSGIQRMIMMMTLKWTFGNPKARENVWPNSLIMIGIGGKKVALLRGDNFAN